MCGKKEEEIGSTSSTTVKIQPKKEAFSEELTNMQTTEKVSSSVFIVGKYIVHLKTNKSIKTRIVKETV